MYKSEIFTVYSVQYSLRTEEVLPPLAPDTVHIEYTRTFM